MSQHVHVHVIKSKVEDMKTLFKYILIFYQNLIDYQDSENSVYSIWYCI